MNINFIEKVKQLYTDKKGPLVEDKYQIFGWAPGIPMLDETQDKASNIIYEDDLKIEDVIMN